MMHLCLSSLCASSQKRLRYPLLLLALNDFPALELRNRPVLLDPHDVADGVLVGIVVGVVLLRAPHGLLEQRMGEAALDADNHGLVLLVAHHGALEHPLRHLNASLTSTCPRRASAARWSSAARCRGALGARAPCSRAARWRAGSA